MPAHQERLNSLIRVRNDAPNVWLREAVKLGMLKPRAATKARKGSKRAAGGKSATPKAR